MRVIVTGGAGFIGSAVCRHLVLHAGWDVLNVDKLTYAANLASLDPGRRAMPATASCTPTSATARRSTRRSPSSRPTP